MKGVTHLVHQLVHCGEGIWRGVEHRIGEQRYVGLLDDVCLGNSQSKSEHFLEEALFDLWLCTASTDMLCFNTTTCAGL